MEDTANEVSTIFPWILPPKDLNEDTERSHEGHDNEAIVKLDKNMSLKKLSLITSTSDPNNVIPIEHSVQRKTQEVDKNLTTKKVFNAHMALESNNVTAIEMSPKAYTQTTRRNLTKEIIRGDIFPLNGIEEKITSVGDWLDKLNGKQ